MGRRAPRGPDDSDEEGPAAPVIAGAAALRQAGGRYGTLAAVRESAANLRANMATGRAVRAIGRSLVESARAGDIREGVPQRGRDTNINRRAIAAVQAAGLGTVQPAKSTAMTRARVRQTAGLRLRDGQLPK
jgi:hypothetical protein